MHGKIPRSLLQRLELSLSRYTKKKKQNKERERRGSKSCQRKLQREINNGNKNKNKKQVGIFRVYLYVGPKMDHDNIRKHFKENQTTKHNCKSATATTNQVYLSRLFFLVSFFFLLCLQ